MKLYEALNIRQDEFSPVLVFVFQSFFLGTFLGAFDVGANTLFLQVFDQTMIPKAIVVSGFTGIILTSLYSFFQSRMVFSRLALMNLFFVFLATFLLRVGYLVSDSKWLAFACFVLMGPLNIVALVGFWGTVSRLFDLRQGKRLFGIIDTGQVVGVIISSWAVPFMVAQGFVAKNLIFISAFSALFALLLQIVINSRFAQQLKAKIVKSETKSSFMSTMKIPYVRTMALFVVFSMLVAFFVHYLFLAVADERFASNDELAKFLGGLMGTLTFVSILIKTFVYGPLMKNYGLKVGLLVSPVIVAIISAGGAVVGSFFGYTVASGAFTFFFLLISLGKLFQTSLRGSIESPSLKMIYQSLDPSIRYEVQARVDGTINELAALASGIVLTLLSLISFIHLIHYTYFLLAIIAVWFVITIKLYRGYRQTLEDTLAQSSQKVVVRSEYIILKESLCGLSLATQMQVIEQSKPWLLKEFMRDSLNAGADVNVVKFILAKIRSLGEVSFIIDLEKIRQRYDHVAINETIDYLKQLIKDSENISKVKGLLTSKDFNDRIHAARLLGASTSHELRNNLTFLMRDLVPAVKRQAIWASRGTRSKEIITFLIDFLDRDQYAPLAHAALLGSGETGMEMLELALQRTNTSSHFKERILRIIPETGSAIAGSVLLGNLSVKSNLKSVVLEGLLKLHFVADEKERIAISKMLIEQAGVCAWNLNVFYHCPPASESPYLKDELEQEYHRSIHCLFNLLKLVYEKSSIDAVLENLEVGTGQSISYAVEMMDTFMEEDLKPYIVPLLEDTSIANKLWALESYFPLRHYSYDHLLRAIINRDNNLISKQAKIYALNAFRFKGQNEINADLVAQMFNTDKFLRLLSAQIIEGIDRNEYMSCRTRLSDKLRVELDRVMENSQITQRAVVERIQFYKGLFNNKFDNDNLLFILYQTSVARFNNTDLNGVELFKGKVYLMLVEAGGITVVKDDQVVKTYPMGSIINTTGINGKPWRLITQADTIVHYIEFDRVVHSMYDHGYLIKHIGEYYTTLNTNTTE